MSGVLCILVGSNAASALLGLSLSPGDIYTSRAGAGSSISSADTATATGGSTPYTYAWTRVSGSSYTINSPTSAATTFTTTLAPSGYKTGVYRCTVTDSLGAIAMADATIEFEAF